MSVGARRGSGASQGGHFQRTTLAAYTHDCTVLLADSSHGDSHVGSVSPAATRTRTLALTLTRTLTLALTLPLTRSRTPPLPVPLAGGGKGRAIARR